MLAAREVAKWTNRFAVTRDGRRVTTYDSVQRPADPGSFTLDGRRYALPGSIWDDRLTLLDEHAAVAAVADSAGSGWTVTAGGQTYHLRRTAFWGGSYQLDAGDLPIGTVRRNGRWQRGFDLDLPGLPTQLQIFMLALVVARWDKRIANRAVRL